VVLKFAGVDSIGDAEQLAGLELQIPQEQRVELEAGVAYVSDLVGCEVQVHTAGGLCAIGVISDVQFGAGEAPLLVVKGKSGVREHEYLLPYAEEFLKKMDLEQRRVEMELPEGLLEAQAPLNAEEKQRQKLEASEARAAGERRKGHE
jgi:16S rRNA processing protein RimM